MDRELRERVLINAAVAVAQKRGLRGLTVQGVATESGLPLRTVYRWSGKRKRLRGMVIRYARTCGLQTIVAEAEALHL